MESSQELSDDKMYPRAKPILFSVGNSCVTSYSWLPFFELHHCIVPGKPMRVQNGCGCMTLRTGSIVIASLSLIGSVISVITVSIYMGQIDNPDFKISHASAVLIGPFGIGIIVYSIIHAVFAGLMIFGSVHRNPGYMFPWVANGFVGVVFNIVVTLAIIIGSVFFLQIQKMAAVVAFYTTTTALTIYLWLIVYSHYKDLLAEKYGYQSKPTEGKIFGQPMNPYHHV